MLIRSRTRTAYHSILGVEERASSVHLDAAATIRIYCLVLNELGLQFHWFQFRDALTIDLIRLLLRDVLCRSQSSIDDPEALSAFKFPHIYII